MAYMEWSDALSCGFEEIDNDHRRLLELFNDLHASVEDELDVDHIGGIFEELLGYTSWHFRHEERLMQQYEYPDYFAHKEIHDELTGQAKGLYEEFAAGDASVPGKLLPFLKDWLTQHIMVTDKKTGQFIAAPPD